MSRAKRVLFLDVHNAGASQLAEAILRRLAPDYEACSAGVEPQEIEPAVRKVLAERDLDGSSLRPEGVEEYLAKKAIEVAVLLGTREERTSPHIYPFAKRTAIWDCHDPNELPDDEGARVQVFRALAEDLDRRIRRWLDEERGSSDRRSARASQVGRGDRSSYAP